jgi:hypothetical protein
LLQNKDIYAGYAGNAELKLKAVTYNGSKSPLSGSLNITLEKASAISPENEVKFNIDGKLHNVMDSDVHISGIMSNNKEGPIAVPAPILKARRFAYQMLLPFVSYL